MYTYIISQFFGKSRIGLNVLLKLPKNTYLFFLQARDSVPAGPKIVLVPLQSNFKYIYVCPHLEDYHAVYTHCIGRTHSLAITSSPPPPPPPACKVGVVSIIELVDLEQTLLYFLAAIYD